MSYIDVDPVTNPVMALGNHMDPPVCLLFHECHLTLDHCDIYFDSCFMTDTLDNSCPSYPKKSTIHQVSVNGFSQSHFCHLAFSRLKMHHLNLLLLPGHELVLLPLGLLYISLIIFPEEKCDRTTE